jgi:hypothetical protein
MHELWCRNLCSYYGRNYVHVVPHGVLRSIYRILDVYKLPLRLLPSSDRHGDVLHLCSGHLRCRRGFNFFDKLHQMRSWHICSQLGLWNVQQLCSGNISSKPRLYKLQ